MRHRQVPRKSPNVLPTAMKAALLVRPHILSYMSFEAAFIQRAAYFERCALGSIVLGPLDCSAIMISEDVLVQVFHCSSLPGKA